jgi:hypothetical protein
MAAAWDTVSGQQSASLQKRFGRTLDRGADIVADVVEIIEENGSQAALGSEPHHLSRQ